MVVNELKELSKKADIVSCRRAVVSSYELGFITAEQVVLDLDITEVKLIRQDLRLVELTLVKMNINDVYIHRWL